MMDQNNYPDLHTSDSETGNSTAEHISMQNDTPADTSASAGNNASAASAENSEYTSVPIYGGAPSSQPSYSYSQQNTNGGYYPYANGQWQYAQSQPPKKKEKKEHPFLKKLGKTAAIAAVFGVIAGAAFQGIGAAANKITGGNTGSVASVITTSTTGKQTAVYDVSEIVKNTMPSMVAIDITITTTVQNPFAIFGYGGSYQQEATGSGTGIIISESDDTLYIVTNYHVIEDANSITVTFCDNSSVSAVVKGSDEDSDLAVIAVSLSDIDADTRSAIRIAVMGDSEQLQLGEPAIAIGNALGYGQSVTVGNISALAKEVQLTDKTMNLIQTDAAINPGNSGGALINANGEVIGINSVKYASTEVEGIGYAIPISDAVPIINALMNGTALPESEKPYLGITGTDVTAQYQERFGLPEGVYVSQVTANSPAAKAGMCNYDIITSFDGQSITSMEELTKALNAKKAGDTVTITVKRHSDGAYQEQELTVTLDSVSNAPDTDDSQSSGSSSGRYGYGFFD